MAEIVEASTRLILFTIQMLLLAHFEGEVVDVAVLEDFDGFSYSEDVAVVLRCLHRGKRTDEYEQLWLLPELAPRCEVEM